MQKLIYTIGLPGSGKSTWAKKMVEENDHYKRVNKDDLRAMIDASKWSKSNEKFIIKVRDYIILEALREGKSVICDDTNFGPHGKRFQELVDSINKEFRRNKVILECNDSFLSVSVEECIQRDLKRFNSVGKDVIMRMYNQYIARPIKYIKQDESLPKIYLCDIDGTIAKMNGRSPFDWKSVGEDLPNESVISTIKILHSNQRPIIFMSGRDACCRTETENWIKTHVGIESPLLYMRSEGDKRKDSIVKRELYEQHIKDKYYVVAVFDDRDQVVNMWRKELFLPVFQVDYGDF